MAWGQLGRELGAIGTVVGDAIKRFFCIEDDDEERCKRVYEQCADDCADIFAEDPDSLPGTGRDYASRLRRCIADCVRAAGCSPSAY